ncbi:MAG: restriction endonuclease [Rhodocyclaceae bacterium]|nr:restriction endonuclease [Rhodocyclaceae bacterium]
MSIPDFQSLMLPLLQFTADEREHSRSEAVDALAKTFALSEEERALPLSSGRETVFANRVGWAITYLKKAGLLTSMQRGFFRISPRGKEVLAEKPSALSIKDLMRFPEFREFRAVAANADDEIRHDQERQAYSPEEMLDSAARAMRARLAEELLERIKECSPQFFERLVIDLLVKMGYGGSPREAAQHLGRSGDGGIDGLIKEDPLGFDVVYLQAKRWQNVVGRPEVQRFVGALQGLRARKGVFLTTSWFTPEAIDYVKYIDPKVVLIDGRTLAELMIDHDVGVTVAEVFAVKRIDSDYFEES